MHLMLRNRLALQLCQVRQKGSQASSNASRQSRILGKLFGSRVVGSKKRWYPSHDTGNASGHGAGHQPPSVIFQASQFGKSSQSHGSKQNIRRGVVLNKLFMTHITDLLAASEIAEGVQGLGLQVTRVKISSDFSCINVYWLGSGDLLSDTTLETELQRCSGQIRHELSQLRLMGEVPRITFVRDKTGSNQHEVEGILRTLHTDPEREENTEDVDRQEFDLAQIARQAFFGNAAADPAAIIANAGLPEMRHDVLGLDHRFIMQKILGKMRKSKEAWEQHQQPGNVQFSIKYDAQEHVRMQRKMGEAAQSADKFNAFLANRRERKQTPERKKHHKDEIDFYQAATFSAQQDDDDLQLLSPEQKQRYVQEDYIVEDESINKCK